MTSHSAELRRCRPLLGTFVEIGGRRLRRQRTPARRSRRPSRRSTRVQRLMSFHEDASDVSRLNRDAARRAVEVDPWTYEVLEAARGFHETSRGVFDVTVAPQLQRWGYLPATPDARRRRDDRPRRISPRSSCFPGSACASAVPCASTSAASPRASPSIAPSTRSRHAGASSGIVNAGGDLRVFGAPRARGSTSAIRASPGALLPLLRRSPTPRSRRRPATSRAAAGAGAGSRRWSIPRGGGPARGPRASRCAPRPASRPTRSPRSLMLLGAAQRRDPARARGVRLRGRRRDGDVIAAGGCA